MKTTTGLFILAMGAAIVAASSVAVPAEAAPLVDRPIVIGHRGASGYRPEHTLASYELAIEQGADFVEPDVVSTRDGVLVARHENEISGTTDVASRPEFASRRTTKVIDGASLTGWFTEDFDLAELKTLRAIERIPQLRPGNTAYNGQFEVPTLQEVMDLVAQKSAEKGREIGIYIETKHPSYFDSIGLSLEEKLVDALNANGYVGNAKPVYLQSFEVGNLQQLNQLTDVPLVQLMDDFGARPADFVLSGDPRTYADLMTPEGLAEIAAYADGIGPWKNTIIGRDANGFLLAPTSLVDDAHGEGLLVHPYTFRSENFNLPADFRVGDPNDPQFQLQWGDYTSELLAFLRLGIDGFFIDFPDHGVQGRDRYLAEVPAPAVAGLLGLGMAGLAALHRRKRNGEP